MRDTSHDSVWIVAQIDSEDSCRLAIGNIEMAIRKYEARWREDGSTPVFLPYYVLRRPIIDNKRAAICYVVVKHWSEIVWGEEPVCRLLPRHLDRLWSHARPNIAARNRDTARINLRAIY